MNTETTLNDLNLAAADAEIRNAIFTDLTHLIATRSNDLETTGFTPEMAQFDCLITLKLLIDELYDRVSINQAKKRWMKELGRNFFQHPE